MTAIQINSSATKQKRQKVSEIRRGTKNSCQRSVSQIWPK